MVTRLRRMAREVAGPVVGRCVGGAAVATAPLAAVVQDGGREGLATGASDDENRKSGEADCGGRRADGAAARSLPAMGRWWRWCGSSRREVRGGCGGAAGVGGGRSGTTAWAPPAAGSGGGRWGWRRCSEEMKKKEVVEKKERRNKKISGPTYCLPRANGRPLRALNE
jgi:hypothetical protein